MVPAATRIAVLVTGASTTETTLREINRAAHAMGVQLQIINAGNSREIDAAFATLHASGPTPSLSVPTLSSAAGACN